MERIINSEIRSEIKKSLNVDASLLGLFYIKTTGTFPLSVRFENLNFKLFISLFLEKFGTQINENVYDEKYSNDTKSYISVQSVWVLNENIFVRINENCFEESLVVLYNHASDKDFLNQIYNTAINCIKKEKIEGTISLLLSENNRLKLKDFPLKNYNTNILKYYNDNIEPFHAKVINQLNKQNDKGLILLHGKPGVGKSTYLRILSQVITNKRFIFITPEVLDQLTSPNFIKFLIPYHNSILVVEDAQVLLSDRRKGNNSSAITNILNLSDGVISDLLRICTVSSIEKIDRALIRKGRLKAIYKFDKLEALKAQQLLNELGHNIEIKEPITLADIFSYSDRIKSNSESTEVKIGFKR